MISLNVLGGLITADICVFHLALYFIAILCVGIYKSTVNGMLTKDTSMLNGGEQKIHHF